MLVISYYLQRNGRKCEFCGMFDSLEDFKAFARVELYRGWKVTAHTVLKEYPDLTVRQRIDQLKAEGKW